MFVEATPNSELLYALKKVEEKHKISSDDKRIKFVEKSGRKLIETVKVADPFRKNCEEEDCAACRKTSAYNNCRKTNIGYSITCNKCKANGVEKVYIGESSRNLYRRTREHMNLLKKKKEKSVLYKHEKENHNDDSKEPDFNFKVEGTFKYPLK